MDRARPVPRTSCAAGRPTARGATSRTRAAGSSTPTPAWRSSSRSQEVSTQVPEIPPVVATHKGFALPGLRPARRRRRATSARRRRQNPGVRFLVYHSGYDIGDTQGPYRGDARRRLEHEHGRRADQEPAREQLRRDAGSARRASKFGNVPNVYAELGSVWRDVDARPRPGRAPARQADHPRRAEADRLGHRQPLVRLAAGRRSSALRRFEFTEEGKELYGLPYGLEGDVEDPTRKAAAARSARSATGSSAATPRRAYEIDPDARRRRDRLRRGPRLARAGLPARRPAPSASRRRSRRTRSPGPRTRREVDAEPARTDRGRRERALRCVAVIAAVARARAPAAPPASARRQARARACAAPTSAGGEWRDATATTSPTRASRPREKVISPRRRAAARRRRGASPPRTPAATATSPARRSSPTAACTSRPHAAGSSPSTPTPASWSGRRSCPTAAA